jgi:Protein of unknown function (DUF1592)/Protein of unknown function (DUF1588)/Protein of unknown function (DUF1587)/Protein of unknown function (DUF1595)/Protein of unknown function (DUF1585)
VKYPARPWLRLAATCVLLLSVVPVALAQSKPIATDESYFAEKLFPLMHNAQCNLCHNDNGVAAATRLQFPSAEAKPEEITAFGLGLVKLVDRARPEKSLLLLKPTNRIPHTGGERFAPGSKEEGVLLGWIHYLAGLSDKQLGEAEQRLTRDDRHGLEPLTVRRLTHSQYNNTVRDLLGDQSRPADGFPKEDFVHGFKNQLEAQGVPPLQAEAYSEAAERLARSAFRGGDHQGLIPCQPAASTDPVCAAKFVRQFGLKAFRRPLDDGETNVYGELFRQEAERTGDFLGGAQMVVEAMLQSPHFLFRVERGAGSPYQQYEIASRLSYFLWDTMPDEELFAAAEKGELSTVEQVETAARKMLADPRAKSSLEEFLAQWLRFDRALSAIRDRRLFRGFSTELAAAMTEETRRLFDHLVWEDQNFMDFFTADYTYLSTDLARLYGLPAPPEEFGQVAYPPDSGRSGVLGHGSFLTLTSKPSDTSPTERGLFVRAEFLCHEVPPPPPGVNTSLPVITEAKPMTNRERLGIHLNSEACATCHRLIDPIGLGFEHYDAIGAFRQEMTLSFVADDEEEEGHRRKRIEVKLPIDTTSHVQGIENSEFSTPKELGRILAADGACQKCIVKKLFRYAFGREETAADQPAIEAILKAFQESGFRFRELVVALITSKPFLEGGPS